MNGFFKDPLLMKLFNSSIGPGFRGEWDQQLNVCDPTGATNETILFYDRPLLENGAPVGDWRHSHSMSKVSPCGSTSGWGVLHHQTSMGSIPTSDYPGIEILYVGSSTGKVYLHAATITPLFPPSAPTGLAVQEAHRDSISLGWNDTSDNEVSFQIERKKLEDPSWALLADVVAGTTVYRDVSVQLATTYQYRVRATNAGGSSDWAGPVEATAGCALDSDCDGLSNSDETDLLGTDPKKPDTDGDGLLDPWESPPALIDSNGQEQIIDNAGFTALTVPALGTSEFSSEDVLGPFGLTDCPPEPDEDRRPHYPRECLNHAPDPLHKDVFLELDWQDCAAGDCFPYDPLHHAPDMRGLGMVVETFADATVANPDGSNGVNLNIHVDEPIPHDPNCDQDTSAVRTQYFGTENQRAFGTSVLLAKELAVRYVWSGHSSRDDHHGNCPAPGPAQAFTTGMGWDPLMPYDWSAFGDANVGGRDLLVTLGILWSCHSDIEQSAFGATLDCYRQIVPGVFPAHVQDHTGQDQDLPYPIARLVGLDEDDGTSYLWARTLAHLLGHSLGHAYDSDVGNIPSQPADDSNGDGVRDLDNSVDGYSGWSGLLWAPSGEGTPTEEAFPDYDSLIASDLDSDGQAEGQDNCPGVNNPAEPNLTGAAQPDFDRDGRGDACDDDADADGLPETSRSSASIDPLPFDTDNDGLENGVDPDDDGDGQPDLIDNCELIRNSAQVNADTDDLGDACDPDADGDQIMDAVASQLTATEFDALIARQPRPSTVSLYDYMMGNR